MCVCVYVCVINCNVLFCCRYGVIKHHENMMMMMINGHGVSNQATAPTVTYLVEL